MLKGYNVDSDITDMLNKMDWVIMPVVNVDGYVYSWKDRGTRLWRKTRQRHFSGSCVGVDPNRNFDYQYGRK